VLAGRHERKRHFERPRHRWEDNMKVDYEVVGWEGEKWIHPAQNRVKNWAIINTILN
jgi:hypothetical protein